MSLSAIGVRAASENLEVSKLSSGIKYLDSFLDGGLPLGAITEWGVPLGRGGRAVVMNFLSTLLSRELDEKPRWGLWAYSRPQLMVYPPAWAAHGIELSRVRFAFSENPITDLKPVFLDPWFRIIVLDAPRSLSIDDCAFLSRVARDNNQSIVILRDFFLGSRRGNVFAKLRVNCWQNHSTKKFHLKVVRGLSPRQIALDINTKR